MAERVYARAELEDRDFVPAFFSRKTTRKAREAVLRRQLQPSVMPHGGVAFGHSDLALQAVCWGVDQMVNDRYLRTSRPAQVTTSSCWSIGLWLHAIWRRMTGGRPSVPENL